MERFSYNGGCGLRVCIKVFKTELAWAIDKWLRVISNTNIIKNSYTTKNPKNKPF